MIITIVLTVSRDEYLTDVLSALELMDCDPTYTNLLCVVDGDNKLYVKVRNLIQTTKFNERLTIRYPEIKPVKRFDTIARRKRITKIHNFAKSNIGITDYVFLTEDDTVVPRDALNKLIPIIRDTPGCVYVEGVEVGRWGTLYIGAWRFDDVYNPNKTTSLPYKQSGIEAIDAGGLYCALMDAKIYKEHDFHTYQSLGPDISMGLRLRQDGYTNMIDYSVVCKHINRKLKGEREILIPDDSVVEVTIQKKNDTFWETLPIDKHKGDAI